MSLNTGDIFEGIYQLEERVSVTGHGRTSRWLADDITAYRRNEVIIDTILADFEDDLHWQAQVFGLREIGQSVETNCRYFVWEKENAQPISRCEVENMTDTLRKRLADLIDAVPVGPHETILPEAPPEYWQAGMNGAMIFYRKITAVNHTRASIPEVKEVWKRNLFAAAPVQPDSSERQPGPTLSSSPSPWPLWLIVVGIALAIGVYSLRFSPPGASPPEPDSRLAAFNQALEQGVAFEKKGAYEEAVQSFETAVGKAPVSDETDERLDSLATAYAAYAHSACERYRAVGSTQLYFIPNQYYHYAAILSRDYTPRTCN